MFDLHIPFFLPLWRRLLVTAIACGWALFELLTGAIGWAILFGAVGALCLQQFFVVWDPERAARGKDKT